MPEERYYAKIKLNFPLDNAIKRGNENTCKILGDLPTQNEVSDPRQNISISSFSNTEH